MRKTKKTLAILAIVAMVFTMIPMQLFAATATTYDRIGGTTQYDTAAQIAKAGFPSGASTAIIAVGTVGNSYDALAAGPLAVKKSAPILLTESAQLTAVTKSTLQSLGVKNVIIVGGTGVIKQSVEDAIKALGISTSRLAGADAAETSVKVAQQVGASSAIVLAGGKGQDALSVASIAAAKGYPILYTNKASNLPDTVANYVATLSGVSTSYVIGGKGVIYDAEALQLPGTVVRYGGYDAYDTNLAVIQGLVGSISFGQVYVANGQTMVDALAGAPLAAKYNSAIVLTDNTKIPAAQFVNTQLSASSEAIALGGTAAVSDSILHQISYTAPVENAPKITGVTSPDANTLVVTFDKSVINSAAQPAAVVVKQGSTAVELASSAFTADQMTLTVKTKAPLTASTAYSISVTPVNRDAITYSFTTPANYPPTAISVAKGNDFKTLIVTFDKAVADTSKAVFTVKKGDTTVAQTATFGPDKTTATLLFEAPLAAGDYTVSVSGLSASALTKTYTAPAPNPSTITVAKGSDDSTVTVTFDAPVADTTKAVFTVKKGDDVVEQTAAFNEANTVATLTFADALTSGDYTVSVSGVSADALTGTYTVPASAVQSVSAVNSNIPVGGTTAFTFADSTGAAVTPTGVTYKVTSDNAANGFFNNGVFTATAPGAYTIEATVGTAKLTTTVYVSGTAAAVKLSAPTAFVANGYSTQVITATVVDANGNKVSNFNGTATAHYNTIGGASKFVPSTDTNNPVHYNDGTASTADLTLTFVNGTATFTVVAGLAPGLTDKIAINTLTDSVSGAVSGYQAATVSVSTSATQQATGISVKTSAKSIEVNDNAGSANFTVQVTDQTGNAMLGGTYVLTATLAGGGSLTPISSGVKTTSTIVVSAGVAQTVTVYGVQGTVGTYTLTVTGANLAAGGASIPTVIAGNAAMLKLTNSTPSFIQGAAGTTFNIGATDANGNTTAYPATTVPEVFITDANGNVATFFTIGGGTLGADNGYTLTAGATSFIIQDLTAVSHAGTYNVVVKDTEATNALAQVTSSFTVKPQSAPTKVVVTAEKTTLVGSNATTTVTVQATDAFGNAVAVPTGTAATVNLSAANAGNGSASFNGGAASTTPSVTLTLDATGKATATFTAQDYDGAQWTLTGDPTFAGTNGTVIIYITDHPAASFSFGLKDNAPSGTYAGNTVYAAAGDPIVTSASLDATAKDAYGNSVTAPNDTVTLVINHASGIQGLPAGIVGSVTKTVNTTNDTVTYTGSLSAVSALIDGATLTGGKAGAVSFVLTDNATGATGSATIQVVAGTAVTAVAVPEIAGTTIAKNAATPITVTLVDAGGNAVVAAHDTTITLGATNGVTFQNTSRLPITSVTIKAGYSTATAFIVTPASGTTVVTVTDTTDGAVTAFTATLTIQ